MTKPKVADGEISPWKNSKGITINEDATTSRGRVTKLPIMSGKTKGKEKAHHHQNTFDSDGTYATHVATSPKKGEHRANHITVS